MSSLFETRQKASDFASKYDKSLSFQKRLVIWDRLINQYSIKGGYCIDAGCGSGAITMLSLIRGMHVFAFDPSIEIVQIARSYLSEYKDQVQFELLQLPLFDKIDFIKGEANLITCSSVLEYVENIETALVDLRHMLHEDGYLIVSLPNFDSLIRKLEKYVLKKILPATRAYLQLQKHQYSYKSAKDLFKNSGFRIIEYKYYGIPSKLYPLGINEASSSWGTMIIFVLKKSDSSL